MTQLLSSLALTFCFAQSTPQSEYQFKHTEPQINYEKCPHNDAECNTARKKEVTDRQRWDYLCKPQSDRRVGESTTERQDRRRRLSKSEREEEDKIARAQNELSFIDDKKSLEKDLAEFFLFAQMFREKVSKNQPTGWNCWKGMKISPTEMSNVRFIESKISEIDLLLTIKNPYDLEPTLYAKCWYCTPHIPLRMQLRAEGNPNWVFFSIEDGGSRAPQHIIDREMKKHYGESSEKSDETSNFIAVLLLTTLFVGVPVLFVIFVARLAA